MRGQPGPQLPGERRDALGRLGRAGQRARQLVAQRPGPGLRQVAVVGAGRRRALAAHDLPDHAELAARGPRLDRRPRPQQPDQLVAGRPRAAPPRPRQLVDEQRHRAGRRRGVPRVVPRELGQPGVGTRRSRIRDRAAGSRGRRLGIAVLARALPVLLPRLPVHRDPRSMMIIVNSLSTRILLQLNSLCCGRHLPERYTFLTWLPLEDARPAELNSRSIIPNGRVLRVDPASRQPYKGQTTRRTEPSPWPSYRVHGIERDPAERGDPRT